MVYDCLIENVWLHDGLGSPAQHADLAIQAGRIAEIRYYGESLPAEDRGLSPDKLGPASRQQHLGATRQALTGAIVRLACVAKRGSKARACILRRALSMFTPTTTPHS
ncbi:MAG: hypothetical protein ACKO19_05175 [Betaproteobacteria bacterium]